MPDNKDFFNNTVSSKGQLKENEFVSFNIKENEKLRVLFVGNSITRHGICEDIGWRRDCGMAASSIDNDYVHRTVKKLEEIYDTVSIGIAQIADWERNFYNDTVLEKYNAVLEFNADVVIIRVGENVYHTDEELEKYDFNTNFGKMAAYFFGNAERKVVTGLFWARDSIERMIKKIAEDNDYIFVSIKHIGEQDKCKALNEYAHSGVACHPNDFGMKKISDEIISKLGL